MAVGTVRSRDRGEEGSAGVGTGRIEIGTLDLDEQCTWNNDHRSFKETGRILECRGGRLWDYGGHTGVETDEICPRCKGHGMHPTALGWEVLEFVRQYGGWERD